MDGKNLLAERFEAHRPHLRAVAHRMLGSASEAEDAVQETWLRFTRAGTDDVDNLRGWLTTVTARLCLDVLRSRKIRREESIDVSAEAAAVTGEENPERDAILADSVGLALLVVLEKLTPAERVAFVLHDMFDLPFEEIAPIVDRTPAATRQLASRARRRVQDAPETPDADMGRRRRLVEAFLAASRSGDLEPLLAVLDPDVVFRPDATAARMGGTGETRGAQAVAALFRGRAQAAKPALVDGEPALVVAPGGQLRIVVQLGIADGRIARLDAIADPERLGGFEIEML